MKCTKCKKTAEEGFLYDGKNWALFDNEAEGLELFSFYCRDCVELVLSNLIDKTISTLETKK